MDDKERARMDRPGGGRGRAKALPGENYLVRRPNSLDWHYDVSIDGHRLRGSCGTTDKVAAAELAHLEYQRLWREVKLGEKPVPHMDVNEAFIRFYTEKAKGTSYGEGGQKHQMNAMLRVLGPKTRLAALDDGIINDMVQRLRRTEILPHNLAVPDPRRVPRYLSTSTINRYLVTLSSVCRRAREVWKVQVGEWTLGRHTGVEPENREVFLDHEQARRLVQVATPHLRPILLIALMTGLRKANVHELAWENISVDFGRAVLIQKGDKRLSVSLPPPAVQLLVNLQPDPALRVGRVFLFGNPAVPCDCASCRSPARRGEPINSTKRSFATAAKLAGLRDLPNGRLRFHDMRHTMASWLLAAGGDLVIVKEALGHADISTTQRYAHIMPGRQAAVIESATAGLTSPLLIEADKKKA